MEGLFPNNVRISVDVGDLTLLVFILDYIAKGADLEIKYFSGVGARNGLIERYIGGGLATGEVTSTIIDAISDLATNYRSGDEIVVLGYSRGSYTGRSFIGFLDRVGLPTDGDRHILHHLYNKYTSGEFLKRDVASHLRRKYNCVHVEIKTLLCIDTVGALGIPHTGIFSLLDLLPPLIRKQQFMEANAASNVQVLLHALALHESRGPFQPTLMQIEGASRQTLKQVWFLGSHGDVANGDERGSIGDIVLAWCVANLETHAGIAFDEVKLSARFPRMGADLPMSNGLVWVHDDIRDPVKGLWRLMGRSIRVPNKQVLLMVSAQMKVFMKQHAFAVTVVAVVDSPGDMRTVYDIGVTWNIASKSKITWFSST
ncbi:hypothetical protein LMH87_009744 [Akanthomyces muscarius]|uniref:T6SS Phospholipase effector Tle1-like catalytic domain-containing protein n=1 Tax=Akanthomyces muscarius TaxID=2231603 RepID=A0A9W8QDK1_AKAMU|nr:hypothetical protein LMH87_009744 [Akanthomyces muscarius]KAJ4153247.1 hypothetical protein LMH87_009744 [Akanthomyces muscarius]